MNVGIISMYEHSFCYKNIYTLQVIIKTNKPENNISLFQILLDFISYHESLFMLNRYLKLGF